MIYIDPPYNTGKDFVYPDNFKDNLKNYLEITGQVGEEGQKLSTNSDTSGRYHSDWLNMMYPRLKLARNLLTDDGVIFISIDDNEVHNLRKICDEIFGEENFKTHFIWKKKSTTSNVSGAQVSSLTEFILCYGKSNNSKIKPKVVLAETRNYSYSDDDGKYRLTVIEKKDSGAYKRDTMKYTILNTFPRDGKRWQIGEEKARELENKGRFILGEDGVIRLKIYDYEDTNTTSAQANLYIEYGTTESAAKELNTNIFGIPELFDNPKPIDLLGKLISIILDDNDLILDFFSGSATTAHATMQLNAEDGGNRKYIMVQLPEPTPDNSEASKAGYKNICEIGKERIRRAGEKVKSDST
ncbi:MAG: site-specific DNA-methyltransferase, partial [Cetobacterium sp.]